MFDRTFFSSLNSNIVFQMNTFWTSFLLLHSISASLNQTVDCINKLLNTWDISIMFCVFLALKSVGEEDMSKIKVTF